MANELEQPMVYQIRIKGHLGPQWRDWFGDLAITLEENGDTLLTGPVKSVSPLSSRVMARPPNQSLH